MNEVYTQYDGTGQQGAQVDPNTNAPDLSPAYARPTFQEACLEANAYTTDEWSLDAVQYARQAEAAFTDVFNWIPTQMQVIPLAPGLARLTLDGLLFEAYGTEDLVMFRLATTCPTCLATVWAEDVITRERVGWHLENPQSCVTCFSSKSPMAARVSLSDLESIEHEYTHTSMTLLTTRLAYQDAKQGLENVRAKILLEGYQKPAEGKSPILAALGSAPNNKDTRELAETAYLADCDVYRRAYALTKLAEAQLGVDRLSHEATDVKRSLTRAFLDGGKSARK